MTFKLTKASCYEHEEQIEIKTLDELKYLQEKYAIPEDEDFWNNPSIIIDFNEMTITIYDYYIE